MADNPRRWINNNPEWLLSLCRSGCQHYHLCNHKQFCLLDAGPVIPPQFPPLLVDRLDEVFQRRLQGKRPVCLRWQQHPPVSVLHLAYHVYPSAQNDGWRWNLRELTKRWKVFNGRRVVAIAVDESTVPVRDVLNEFPDLWGAEVLELPNDPALRETATLPNLLKAVKSVAWTDAVFYGHTKGNTTADNPLGAKRWTATMYSKLLDGVEEVKEKLRKFSAVGTTIMAWGKGREAPYPSGLDWGRWMFAGTFWWARCDRIFQDPRWTFVPYDRYGAEAYLSGILPLEEVHSLFQPWQAVAGEPRCEDGPYNPQWYPPTGDEP